MARFLVVTTVHTVVDDPTVTTADVAVTNAKAQITTAVAGTITANAIVGSIARSALSETNASLTASIHGPESS